MEPLLQYFSNDFMPHGHCYLWTPSILWMNVVSDVFIALSYFSIPFLLHNIIRKREDWKFKGLFIFFSAFIFWCGVTHVMSIVTVWNGIYGIQGLTKLITALISFSTALLLYRFRPQILRIPSIEQIEAVKQEMARKEFDNLRLQAERKAESEAERLVKITLDAAPVGLLALDAHGVIKIANNELLNIFGYQRDELVGKPAQMLLSEHTEMSPFNDEKLTALLQSSDKQSIHSAGQITNGLRKNLSIVPVEVRLQDEIVNNERVIFASVSDQTMRLKADQSQREAQELLIQKNKELELSNKELEQFAFIASHDLKEPLRKIMSFGNLIREDENNISLKSMEFLSYIQEAAERMQALLQSLLEYSRVTLRAKPFNEVNLNNVLKNVLDDIELLLKERDAVIKIEDLPVIHADIAQMHQLFQNIIENSLKYIKDDIRPEIFISAETDAERCTISVRDNGIGFDEKYSNQIFEVFKRLHGRGRYKGTGVGLAICRKIMERHKGDISVKSAPDQGAEFKLHFSKTFKEIGI